MMTYKVQIDDLVRDATPDETSQIEQRHAEELARIAALEAVASAKVSGRAKLAALGLADAEIAALLGA